MPPISPVGKFEDFWFVYPNKQRRYLETIQEELPEQAEYGIKPGEKELVGVEEAWWKYGLNGWERQVCVKKSLAAATEGFW